MTQQFTEFTVIIGNTAQYFTISYYTQMIAQTLFTSLIILRYSGIFTFFLNVLDKRV